MWKLGDLNVQGELGWLSSAHAGCPADAGGELQRLGFAGEDHSHRSGRGEKDALAAFDHPNREDRVASSKVDLFGVKSVGIVGGGRGQGRQVLGARSDSGRW